jgi:hypothetical protein
MKYFLRVFSAIDQHIRFAHNPGAVAAMFVFAGIVMAGVCFCIFWTLRRRRHRQRASMVEPFPETTYPFEYPGNLSLMRNVANDRNDIVWGTRGFGLVNGDEEARRVPGQVSEIQHNLAGIGANPAAIYRAAHPQDPFGDNMAVDMSATTDQTQSTIVPDPAVSTLSFYLSSLAHIDGEDCDPSYKRESGGSEMSQTDTIRLPWDSTLPLQLSAKKSLYFNSFQFQGTPLILQSRLSQICIPSPQPQTAHSIRLKNAGRSSHEFS